MRPQRFFSLLGISLVTVSTAPLASELSYTFIDFQYITQETDLGGVQQPVPSQIVGIQTDDGDGISVSGSVSFRDRYFISANFKSAIIDLAGNITNPSVTTSVFDNFDFVNTSLGFGYIWELSDNFDVYAEGMYETVDYDFGSFAGENFDTEEGGGGARVGFRWNPRPSFELFAAARSSSIGKVNLNSFDYDNDASFRAGFFWYFFEDLGVGLDIDSGEVDTFTLSMRFSFGTLPW